MRILIEGGRVIDPANKVDAVLDLWIEDGRIAALGPQPPVRNAPPPDRVLDARGKVVCPGFVDLHVHLREPGREDKETIATGTRAAARGGFTSVCCMPNTNPVNDNQSVTEFILDRARKEGAVNVFPVGAITKGQQGEELAEIGELVRAGCLAISDDGKPVMNAEIMRRALEYAGMFSIPVIQHAEDLHMTGKGVMHEGLVSTDLGLGGIPAASEAVIVARDILLAELTGSHLHVAHVSTAEAIRLIREAKAKGLHVTCEVTPHHFAVTDEAVRSFSTNAKMSPPLRSSRHVEAIKAGLTDGTIDAIATDHAPHTVQEKEQEFDYAPNGIIGLETAFGLTMTVLVEGEVLTLNQAIARLTSEPARIFNLPKGTLSVGADADVTILDPTREWVVDVRKFASKSRNSPFHGWKLRGEVLATIVGGKVVWELEG
ncbi:MAG: dihydroorotase [candidate division NC10 bacterium]|nr:dihydroorotase [candidate division NC10 bacterium]MBI2114396.1 dihydroorotase [candidate division NC10 bacterium]